MGVIRTRYTHAIRVLEEDITHAKSALDPKLAEFVGEELVEAKDNAGKRYVIKGVESHATLLDVGVMLKEGMNWHVRPERFMKTNTRSKNNIVVFAVTEPKQKCVQYGGCNEWLAITDYIEPKRANAWDKMFFKHREQMAADDYENDEPYEEEETKADMDQTTSECPAVIGSEDELDEPLAKGFHQGTDQHDIATPTNSFQLV